MGKVKLTKGELKRQRDNLQQYRRYLPTLQLKKQQLQVEILHLAVLAEEKRHAEAGKRKAAEAWAGLLADPRVEFVSILKGRQTVTNAKNIAGTDIPVFARVDFDVAEYDPFLTPLWVDNALDSLKALIALREEIAVLEKAILILRHELRITTQRVNLFEKVKIPEAEESIRLIKIYIGDQMANAVGRSKIAKRKIETAMLAEVAA